MLAFTVVTAFTYVSLQMSDRHEATLTPTPTVRDTIGTCIYFTTYESAKQMFGNARGASPTSPFAVMAGGGLCGVVSWVATYPVDVAKTVYQKALIANPHEKVEVPSIKFFQSGSYRGMSSPVIICCMYTDLVNRPRGFGCALMHHQHDLLQHVRGDQKAHQ